MPALAPARARIRCGSSLTGVAVQRTCRSPAGLEVSSSWTGIRSCGPIDLERLTDWRAGVSRRPSGLEPGSAGSAQSAGLAQIRGPGTDPRPVRGLLRSARWRAQHHAHDEEDEEQAHDERERRDVTRLGRLHGASPPGRLRTGIPDRFGLSIDGSPAACVAWPHRHLAIVRRPSLPVTDSGRPHHSARSRSSGHRAVPRRPRSGSPPYPSTRGQSCRPRADR